MGTNRMNRHMLNPKNPIVPMNSDQSQIVEYGRVELARYIMDVSGQFHHLFLHLPEFIPKQVRRGFKLLLQLSSLDG